ncbi:MAG: hypothetical protein IPN66_18190 [Candidatus Competibacteraceae bacterium]|nr:hypothetical protein [Candidatus Competibacteraceae bacterium]MBK8899091.1 hypothetical protein [Candidatus Competibacteraceae bacterium]
MRAVTHDLLSREATDWHQQGLIDRPLLDLLLQRYARRGEFLATLLKWLGIFAILQLGLAVLASIAFLLNSAFVAAALLGATSVGLWYGGVRLATDPRRLYPHTGAILVTASLAGVFGALILAYIASTGQPDDPPVPMLMLLTSALGAFTAYRYRLRWPLLLALLLFFHGLGAWHTYGGHGAYFADIQEPRLMAAVSLGAILLGLWHERRLEVGALRRCVGFGGLYLIFGLLYLNLSLWFLTLPRGPLAWVLVFTAAAIAQIVAGARLRDARLTGFGIVFLAINFYTRYFEQFWDQLSIGMFFVIGGALALIFGYLFERWAQATYSGTG